MKGNTAKRTVDHKIRILLRGVYGNRRECLKDFLMQYPEFRDEEFRCLLARWGANGSAQD